MERQRPEDAASHRPRHVIVSSQRSLSECINVGIKEVTTADIVLHVMA